MHTENTQTKETDTKKTLLADIEKLIAYGKEEPSINPALLMYLEIDDLLSIKKTLLEHAGILSEENKVWLEQFKKYE